MKPARQATLDALCRTIAPAAFAEDDGGASLPADVLARIDSLEPGARRDLRRLIGLLANPAVVLALGELPVPFHRLPDRRRVRLLARMQSARTPALRTAFQALRRVVLASWYVTPAAHRTIGYEAPMPRRAARFAWEGPLPAAALGAGAAGPIGVERADGAASRPERRPDRLSVERLAADAAIEADVAVVGSGAGGAVAAAVLAEAGLAVVVLEEGRHWPVSALDGDEGRLGPELYAERGARATRDLAVSLLQGTAVGGGTLINWMVMLRPPEAVLDEWTRDHGCEGMDGAGMARVLDQVERLTHAATVPSAAHSPNNRRLLEGAEALGLVSRAGSIDAHDCVRAGVCGLGCPYGRKQDTTRTYLPRAQAAGARLVERARALRIVATGPDVGPTGSPKRVELELLGDDGVPFGRASVRARVVVVAAGAVGTPLLLRRSGFGSGGVGRYLRLHPTTAVGAICDDEVYGGAGVPLSAVALPAEPPADGHGWWLECPPMQPALAAVAMPGFGERHRSLLAAYRRLATTIVLARDGAGTSHSQGEVWEDRLGRTRIRYRVGRRERELLADGVETAARLQLAAGAREVHTLHSVGGAIRTEADARAARRRPWGPNRVGVFSAHVMGTCRIGTDPRTSGCGPDGTVHGTRGIHVVDGSVLPTAPGVNPQQTIMAVATVLARRLADGLVSA